ncbi:COQ9 family protein [Rhodocista pekingensis]|uniref:COQ9 family protein n=1 Tax=Rhodocista pekingensis TaxID=201185 RepID=A0ABW2KVY3_9PROT
MTTTPNAIPEAQAAAESVPVSSAESLSADALEFAAAAEEIGVGDDDELTARRDAILLGMLPDVPFDGWTLSAMRRGAEAAGYEPEAAPASFPGGVIQVVEHFSTWADRQMMERLAEANLPALKIRDRITLAVRTRLELLAPYKEAVRRSVAVLALPQNAGAGPRLLYRTVDAMWAAAGDRSTDHNFYTKRLLLAGVQTSTVLYWLEDRSEDDAATWAFLDRRIANVMTLGQGLSKAGNLGGLGKVLDAFPSPVRLMQHLRRQAR